MPPPGVPPPPGSPPPPVGVTVTDCVTLLASALPALTPPQVLQCVLHACDEGAVSLGAFSETLSAVGGNVSEAARRLGVSRNTLYRRMRRSRKDIKHQFYATYP